MKNRDVISAAVGIAAAFVLCIGSPVYECESGYAAERMV